ncbi:MAG TPA: hypothetical protein VMC85_02420 [Desulfomonilaceae bacterium]|nr:hypothetical protein [Desulfomonilaceae bacterium]
MPPVYDIYERKNYRNRIPLTHGVSFELEVRETKLHIQAESDLSAKAKDAIFRYRYQIEEYLRQHPAFRESTGPIQVYASAPEIVRYSDLSSHNTGVPPMTCMSGAIADFVGRDLAADSPRLIVASGGDAFIRCSLPLDIYLYAQGSPMHEKLILALPVMSNTFGVSTYVPGHGIHAITVVSRSACWAASYARDIGDRLVRGERLGSVLERVGRYPDVGGVVIISGTTIVAGGDLVLRSANGDSKT